MTIGKSVSLSEVRSLTTTDREKLKDAGVTNTGKLLDAAKTATAERALAKKVGVSTDAVREAVNRADLLRLTGIGASSADLFENAGVNSVKELARRNPEALAKVLSDYLSKHPELSTRLPSPKTVATLVERAKSIDAPALTTADQARPIAAAAVHKYIDEVLFNTQNPEGATFRDAVLGWRPSTEWDQVKADMHSDVERFVGNARGTSRASLDEVFENSDSFTFSGRLYGLYAEATVAKTGAPGRVYVEID